MTQDALLAVLLLMGFKYGTREKDVLVYIAKGMHIVVHPNTNPSNTGVRITCPGKGVKRLNSTPESVFNFIKKRLL